MTMSNRDGGFVPTDEQKLAILRGMLFSSTGKPPAPGKPMLLFAVPRLDLEFDGDDPDDPDDDHAENTGDGGSWEDDEDDDD